MYARGGSSLPFPVRGASSASAVLLLVLVSQLTFLLDEWALLLHRRGLTLDDLLNPHDEHIALAPVVI